MKIHSIKLCCGKTGCPEVSVIKDTVQIKDDNGNKVIITEGEAKLLGSAIEKLLDTGTI